MADRLVSDESGIGIPRRARRRSRPAVNDPLETRDGPAVAVARPRGASAPGALDGWNSQAAWRWMEGLWTLAGEALGPLAGGGGGPGGPGLGQLGF